jgi:uncharacterized damage-inducible protein DinB
MDAKTLLSGMEFSRARLTGILDAIEKSGQAQAALAWRPGPGRAHIAWQAMHCAATHDKYFNALILGKEATDPQLVSTYGGGSTPSDGGAPSLAEIRAALAKHYEALRKYVVSLPASDFDRVVGPPDRRRSVGESIVLLTWHEAHHQGQIHLTWNLYKQANGVK